jgi:tetratricopeptide (TPR) repeat protein
VEFLKARIAMMKGDWNTTKTILVAIQPKLFEEIDRGVQVDRGVPKLACLCLAQCYRQDGEPDKQMEQYSLALKLDPFLSQAHAGLAEVYLGRGQFGLAADEYLKVVKGPHPDTDSMLALARVSIMMRLREEKDKRDWKLVEQLLDQVEPPTSLTPNVTVLRAEVRLAKGSAGEAADLLRQCVAKFPKNAQVWLALINLAMYQAEKEADPVQKEKKWNQVSEELDQAQKNLGDHPVVREERGSFVVRHKDPQASAVLKKLGENLDDRMPDFARIQLWGDLAALSIQVNDLDLARFYTRKAAEKDPANIRLWCTLCQLDLQAYEKGQTPDLRVFDEQLGTVERMGGQGPFWLYCKAIRALLQSKNTDPQLLQEAQDCLKKALELRHDWSAPAVLAGKIFEIQQEPDLALDSYIRAIHEMGERDTDVIRRTVHLLMPRRRYEDAKALFDYLDKQKSPLVGEMNEDYVYVKVFTGDIADAEKELDKAVAADNKSDKNLLRVGQLYSMLAHRLKLDANKEKREWRTDKEMLRMAQKAVTTLLNARDLNPQSDEVWFAVIQLLVDVGQPHKAKEPLDLIDLAETSLKGERAPLTIAVCCELLDEAWVSWAEAANVQAEIAPPASPQSRALKRLVVSCTQQAQIYAEKARVKYEEAVKISPHNSRVLRQVAAFYMRSGKPDVAQPLLERVVALQTPATLGDACWARRSLADILKDRGDFASLGRAMTLIEENLGKAASIDDKRAKVSLLAADPRKEKIGEAIQFMEDRVVKGADARPGDYFTLAKLYLRKNDWPNYDKRMQSVLGAQKGSVQPEVLAFYIATLLEKNQLKDADTWLQTLEKEDKLKEQAMKPEERSTIPHNFFDTVRLRAEYYFLRGSYDEASNHVMAFLDNPDGQPRDQGERLLLVAMALEKFGDRLKATGKPADVDKFSKKADLIFASLKSREGGDIHYAAYLARQKRAAECLEVLQQCGDKCPAESLQIPALAMIRYRAGSAAQYGQLEKILLAAANRSNRPVSLLLVLAELHAVQQQYDKTIADYREVLAKEPRNYRAMNNLSVGLARSGQNLDEALKLIDDAQAIRGPAAEVLDSRAIVHIARQEYDLALEDLAAAVRDDGAPEQCFHQAWAYWLAGKKPEAAEAFDKARSKDLDPKKLDPREVAVYDKLKVEL